MLAGINTSISDACGKMGLYLGNPSTQSILFKPIQANIADGLRMLRKCVDADYDLTDPTVVEVLALWDATDGMLTSLKAVEYLPEE